MKLNISDSAFSHQTHSCYGRTSINGIEWNRNINPELSGKIFFTDYDLNRAYLHRKSKNIAWLVEPRVINPGMYDTFSNFSNLPFSFVLSSDLNFIDSLENKISAEWIPVGGCWIKNEDCKIYGKTKNISIIASKKKSTEGHRLRHKAIEEFPILRENAYGNGYKQIPYKLEGLKEYRFQVVIENCRTEGYFTEKIIDCFSTGVVPIYWGCPNIGDYFDMNGIISFSSIKELEKIMVTVMDDPESVYKSLESFILKNFELSKEYYLVEDWIYKNKKWIFDE